MSETSKNVGRQIKLKRTELNWSQEELALALGCSHQLISAYENGLVEMPLDSLTELARYCDMPIDWFFLDDRSILVKIVKL